MDSENGGQYQYSNDLQRQATASIARKKVLAAYANAAKKSFENHTDNASTMKEEKVNTTVNAEAWKRYHSAWQEYYQKYYSDYYSTAAKNYVEKERLKDARAKAEEEEILKPVENEDKLRRFIRKKATDSARKSRRHHKLIPIFAGVFVVLLILFLQYNRLIFAPIMAYVAPSSNAASEIESVDPTVIASVSTEPKLIIPKINVDVPVHFGIQVSEVMSAMNNGVAHYRIAGASAFPGEIGNLVITGHSAGDIYSSNPYKFIFSGLERLDEGDLIYVNYEGVRYTYSITKKQVIEPSNVQALIMNTDKPLITLVTCTPLGTSNYRLLVTGEQISPSYETATRNPDDVTVETPTEGTVMPANEPSFFEGIWNWLTGK
ncbi:sortase [Candidatus Saccharibacteria bacterium]|nr:sortase [Candidatus Saccharibacteria bacterium]